MKYLGVLILFSLITPIGLIQGDTEPEMISSQWLTNPVTLDGGITDVNEWSEALPVDLQLTDTTYMNATVWALNDYDWLYILLRVEESVIDTAEGLIAYYWSVADTIYSDLSLIRVSSGDSTTCDAYGWDEITWYIDEEAFPPGENNVEGVGLHDGTYYWFEFRKKLDSGDGYDWKLEFDRVYGLNDGSDWVGGSMFIGLRDVDASITYVKQIELSISRTPTPKIAYFSSIFASNQNRMIYPSDTTPKPLGCGAAWVSDWLASAFIYTKLENVIEGLDTEEGFVNQTTGKALGDAGTGIISFGGQFVNPVVKYAESDGTPDADKAPVKFYLDGSTFRFQYRNGTNIPGAELPQSVINLDQDMFVIEVYEDGDGRYMMLCYGFGWKGTYAAGKYFHTEIYPDLESYPCSWIIVKWDDANGNGFVNTGAEGDTYTIISTG